MTDPDLPNARLSALTAAGVSIWLDDLSRTLIDSGELQRLIDRYAVSGVTTNPTIFQAAISGGEAYAAQVTELARRGLAVDDAVFEVTTQDVRSACDIFAPVSRRTAGVDGRVSIEVDPRLAHREGETVEQAKALYAAVGRDNVLIKIPATVAGLPAITSVLAAGIGVNVTLIFSLERYRAVMEAYLTGLEQARAAGHDLSRIHSVASFFISRVDTEVDRRLAAIGTPEALALRGKAGIANARLAYRAYEETFGTPRWEALAAAGARPQRPLWASTGVKEPAYPDTMYVTELVAAGTVNTMPRKTLDATADHADIFGDAITGRYGDADAVMAALAEAGVEMADVVQVLEEEGVEKFEVSWRDLLQGLQGELEAAGGSSG